MIEGRVGALQCLGRVVVRVVDERDVDAFGVQPSQAGLQRGESAIPAVVAHAGQLGRAVEAVDALDVAGHGHQPTADLGGQDELIARPPA